MPGPDPEEEDQVEQNIEVWDEQKDWVMDEDPSLWDWQMRRVVDAFTDQVTFDTKQVVLEPSGHKIDCWLAETPEQRAVGMAGREWDRVAAMLFVLPEGVTARFATKDSPDMQVAFFDADGTMLSLEQLRASSDATHVVEAVGARFVLEVDPVRLPAEVFEGQTLRFTTSM